jgi:hypothetical protein
MEQQCTCWEVKGQNRKAEVPINKHPATVAVQTWYLRTHARARAHTHTQKEGLKVQLSIV